MSDVQEKPESRIDDFMEDWITEGSQVPPSLVAGAVKSLVLVMKAFLKLQQESAVDNDLRKEILKIHKEAGEVFFKTLKGAEKGQTSMGNNSETHFLVGRVFTSQLFVDSMLKQNSGKTRMASVIVPDVSFEEIKE